MLLLLVLLPSAWPLNIYAYCIFNCNLNNSHTASEWNETHNRNEIRTKLFKSIIFHSNKMFARQFSTLAHTAYTSALPLPALWQATGSLALAHGQWQLPLPFTNLHSIRRQLAAPCSALPTLSIVIVELVECCRCGCYSSLKSFRLQILIKSIIYLCSN